MANQSQPDHSPQQGGIATDEPQRNNRIVTGANAFTAFRFVCAGTVVYCLLQARLIDAFIWALIGFLSDLFDGMFAKKGWLGGASEFGKVWDPIADKVMFFLPTSFLTWVLFTTGYVLAATTLLVALAVVACREPLIALTKYQLAKLEGLQSAIESARASMAMQSVAFLGALLAYALGQPELIPFFAGMIVSATVVSGWDYRSRLRKLKRQQKL